MSKQFRTYQTFFILREAEEMQELLLLHDIVCIIEDDAPGFDPSFANNQFSREFRLKIKAEDFTKADLLLEEQFEQSSEEIGNDYHLLQFTDLELFDILEQPDKWSRFDYFMARKILANRGLPVDEETLKNILNKRMAELSQPKRAKRIQIFRAYFWALAGGFLGLIEGASLLNTKTLPNGQQAKVYDAWSRAHGIIIIVLAALISFGIIAYLVQWY